MAVTDTLGLVGTGREKADVRNDNNHLAASTMMVDIPVQRACIGAPVYQTVEQDVLQEYF